MVGVVGLTVSDGPLARTLPLLSVHASTSAPAAHKSTEVPAMMIVSRVWLSSGTGIIVSCSTSTLSQPAALVSVCAYSPDCVSVSLYQR